MNVRFDQTQDCLGICLIVEPENQAETLLAKLFLDQGNIRFTTVQETIPGCRVEKDALIFVGGYPDDKDTNGDLHGKENDGRA